MASTTPETTTTEGLDDASLKKEFDKIDSDKTGFIEVSDISKNFGPFVPEAYITSALSMVDTNKDGKLSFEEYKKIRTTMGSVKLPPGFFGGVGGS